MATRFLETASSRPRRAIGQHSGKEYSPLQFFLKESKGKFVQNWRISNHLFLFKVLNSVYTEEGAHMEILKALDHLGDVETAAADFYDFLAKQFAHHREASGLFYRMSIQERNHRNLIRFCKRMVSRDSASYHKVDFDVELVSAFLKEVRNFKKLHPSPDLKQAIEFALSLESHAVEGLHSSLMADSNPRMRSLMEQLAEEDSRHVQQLESFARKHMSEEVC